MKTLKGYKNMHIVTAYETAIENRDKVVSQLSRLSMEAATKGDTAAVKTYQELMNDVNAILKPFTE